jgi:hypothetical protein
MAILPRGVTALAGEPRFMTSTDGERCVVFASGELDMASTDQLREVLSALDGPGVVDLSKVTSWTPARSAYSSVPATG